ncbi:MAG: 4Fe-4S binding protein [Candidatus Lokiarchaeota archaeon]|nr:4Fe-4S binding protein [Candidatus Lokiarchaeota archaeon]
MKSQEILSDITEVDLYRKLQEHFDTFPVGYPSTKSGVEIRILKQLFTTEEAKIALNLKFSHSFEDFEPLDSIHERLKSLGFPYTKDELENHLDNLAKKGAIKTLKQYNQKTYSASLFMIGMFEYQVNKLTKEFAEDTQQYMDEVYIEEMGRTLPLQMRTIPVGVSVDHSVEIGNFDDITKLIESMEGPIVIQNCICRQASHALGKSCLATSRLETCMGFGSFAKMYIDLGWGREITKEEAIDILKRNEEEGLIFQPSNSQKPDFICSCCGCCCEALRTLKQFPNPGGIVSTNYYAEIDPDLCTGCSTCIKRCHMEAITLKDDISSINKERCIGCGNCAYACPSEAIEFLKKEQQFSPPSTMAEYYDENLVARTKRKERELRKQARLKKK